MNLQTIANRLAQNPAIVWVKIDVADITKQVISLLWKITLLTTIVIGGIKFLDTIEIEGTDVPSPTHPPKTEVKSSSKPSR